MAQQLEMNWRIKIKDLTKLDSIKAIVKSGVRIYPIGWKLHVLDKNKDYVNGYKALVKRISIKPLDELTEQDAADAGFEDLTSLNKELNDYYKEELEQVNNIITVINFDIVKE
ncbi:hypothetical protein KY328_02620 [Candidatus Woesearchaeota archaeon]|nr:hypothetical protein [Candidatus Woesearchaeota archaeon]